MRHSSFRNAKLRFASFFHSNGDLIRCKYWDGRCHPEITFPLLVDTGNVAQIGLSFECNRDAKLRLLNRQNDINDSCYVVFCKAHDFYHTISPSDQQRPDQNPASFTAARTDCGSENTEPDKRRRGHVAQRLACRATA